MNMPIEEYHTYLHGPVCWSVMEVHSIQVYSRYSTRHCARYRTYVQSVYSHAKQAATHMIMDPEFTGRMMDVFTSELENLSRIFVLERCARNAMRSLEVSLLTVFAVLFMAVNENNSYVHAIKYSNLYIVH
ncbi:hypothetical protein SARC_06356 [Sphaeroforma arctica JP610]|uniref:Uncharacterized protein n=1 Tax=Sphaeroforma arctica JP610 TaxID=667725 RepID=A0A0L0FXL5_9EUKA|nr:hypothetical protein SARC_06356 [Sphaeroforma arctica JP610]KNC81306.1 hypothetical protein SARC_06356 [Sphaeroforma arctica JP610]|eukprot:XP_014155208.1 hypothetical protein SARC_06356 [Sphaeroforma arctica JP610]